MIGRVQRKVIFLKPEVPEKVQKANELCPLPSLIVQGASAGGLPCVV